MGLLRVLIVEDEPLVSMTIEGIVEDTLPSVVSRREPLVWTKR